ncbi:MAG: Ig-like domain-containing protein, partial [Methylococcaceae bacterium]
FEARDITTSGGTLSGLKAGAGGKVYTAQFTPTANTNDLTASFNVAANSYTDAAGNKGAASALSISADTLAPSLTISNDSNVSLTTGQTATITFNFDEQPIGFDMSDISVSAGSIDGFSGSGLTRTVLYTPPRNASGTASITVDSSRYTDVVGNSGNGGNTSISYNTVVASGGGGSAPAAPSVTSLSGKLIDGYISGATVFADANGNGIWDNGEARTTTDGQGNFTLIVAGGSGTLIAYGGTDTSTGHPLTGEYKAPAGSTVITPLTTLVSEMQAANTSLTLSVAQTRVVTGLGLTGVSNLDLTRFDPVAEFNAGTVGADAVQKAGAKLAITVKLLASSLQAADAGISLSTAASQTATQIASLMTGSVVDLTSPTNVHTIVTNTANAVLTNATDRNQVTSIATDLAEVIAANNQL